MKRSSASIRPGPSSRPLKKRRPSPALDLDEISGAESAQSDAGPSRRSSTSSDVDDSTDDQEDEESMRAAQLAALARHQASFLSSSLPSHSHLITPASSKSTVLAKGKGKEKSTRLPLKQGDEIDLLFSNDLQGDNAESSADSGSDSSLASGEGFDEDDGQDFEFGGFDDAGEAVEEEKQVEGVPVPTVVFAPQTNGRIEMSKADRKRFMSAKSTKMMGEDGPIASSSTGKPQTAEEKDDLNNVALDKNLEHLLLTKLLPDAAEHSRPVQKRNAMAGRLLELAAVAPQGHGTSSIREKSYSTQPRKLQTAIVSARSARTEKARVEAEAAGSWVRGIGGLGDAGKKIGGKKDKRGSRDSRERGLGGGIGRFKDGILTLSKKEIEKGSKVEERWDGGKKKKKGGKGGGKAKK